MNKRVSIEDLTCGYYLLNVEEELKEVGDLKPINVDIKEKFADTQLDRGIDDENTN